MPQGSILEPLLFPIYTNDIISNIQSNIYFYADDTSLLQPVDKKHHQLAFDTLNNDLSQIASWAINWNVAFNPDKTEYMIFSNRHAQQYPPLLINDQPLLRKQSQTARADHR